MKRYTHVVVALVCCLGLAVVGCRGITVMPMVPPTATPIPTPTLALETPPTPTEVAEVGIVNGDFSCGLESWEFWEYGSVGPRPSVLVVEWHGKRALRLHREREWASSRGSLGVRQQFGFKVVQGKAVRVDVWLEEQEGKRVGYGAYPFKLELRFGSGEAITLAAYLEAAEPSPFCDAEPGSEIYYLNFWDEWVKAVRVRKGWNTLTLNIPEGETIDFIWLTATGETEAGFETYIANVRLEK